MVYIIYYTGFNQSEKPETSNVVSLPRWLPISIVSYTKQEALFFIMSLFILIAILCRRSRVLLHFICRILDFTDFRIIETLLNKHPLTYSYSYLLTHEFQCSARPLVLSYTSNIILYLFTYLLTYLLACLFTYLPGYHLVVCRMFVSRMPFRSQIET